MSTLTLRKLLLVLTGLAFLIGMEAQGMASAPMTSSAVGTSAMDEACAKMMGNGVAAHIGAKPEPCKRISLDCAMLGCISSPVLPARLAPVGAPVVCARSADWPPLVISRAGLSVEPDLFPPIA